MKEQSSNPYEKVSFILTYDQLEAAYNIYREQFISCDFIRRSLERLEERIGLCNLPYETLRDDPNLLHESYLQFIRLEDCNVAYNDTLEQVINEICIWHIPTAGFAEQNGRNAKLNGRLPFDY